LNQPVNGPTIAFFGLAFTDLEDFSWLHVEVLDPVCYERIDIHGSIVGEGVLHTIAVAALYANAIGTLQGDFDGDIGDKSHHPGAADWYCRRLLLSRFGHR